MKQVRNTKAKSEVLDLINNSDTALSHHIIHEKLGDLCNRVTIYRILDRLEEEGHIHKIVNIDGVVNYARCNSCQKDLHNDNHLHFNCKKCNEVICIENVIPRIDIPKEFIVEEYNFIVSGICPKCA
ncbi:Fur family transcriptional regulator, ferric uptake regulator [Chryseobacterium soldanellicola]|uniref:Fur family transcriptional regulator, ferric uptake regulator n=1 Tax=Chryseobacterium soldanellicola TaxID=311333 RepID=A0A1H1FHZ5_9FLAO|nr:transcriptional repressor [Chryseobacterium soldanellicola]SDR00565.1 Fur family transcriptional regulator, ferric uptake regulator [Chryseobacterium soldanellicola]